MPWDSSIAALGLARPWLLLLLAVVPVHVWRRRRIDGADVLPFASPTLAGRPSSSARTRLLLAEVVLIVLLVFGLAGPYRSTEVERIDDAGIDVALVLDISLSMLAEDFEPNRLEALRRMAAGLLGRRSADRVSLVIFAKDTYVQSPLTTDDSVLAELLAGVTVDAVDQFRSGGTAIGDALLVATDQLVSGRIEGRDQSVILITDGESNEGIDPELAARHLAQQQLDLTVIGVGGLEPVPVFREGRAIGDGLVSVLDEEALQRVAEAGEGTYYRAADTPELEGVFADLARLQAKPLESRVIEHRAPLAPLVALLALVTFVGYGGLTHGARRPLR